MSETKITIGASHDILLTKQDRFFAIREAEWSRLKRLINSSKIGIDWWSIAASVLFGISGSAFLTSITLLESDDKGLRIIVLIIGGATLLMGGLCVVGAIGKRRTRNNAIDEVQICISEIEAQLPKDKNNEENVQK